jgi:hypothetical protein
MYCTPHSQNLKPVKNTLLATRDYSISRSKAVYHFGGCLQKNTPMNVSKQVTVNTRRKKLEVHKAVASWVMTPCIMVGGSQHFGGNSGLWHRVLWWVEANISEEILGYDTVYYGGWKPTFRRKFCVMTPCVMVGGSQHFGGNSGLWHRILRWMEANISEEILGYDTMYYGGWKPTFRRIFWIHLQGRGFLKAFGLFRLRKKK